MLYTVDAGRSHYRIFVVDMASLNHLVKTPADALPASSAHGSTTSMGFVMLRMDVLFK